MKSVGEAMAIGRTFKESLQKALRSLETGRAGLGADGKDPVDVDRTTIERKLSLPSAERVFWIGVAMRYGRDASSPVHEKRRPRLCGRRASRLPWRVRQARRLPAAQARTPAFRFRSMRSTR